MRKSVVLTGVATIAAVAVVAAKVSGGFWPTSSATLDKSREARESGAGVRQGQIPETGRLSRSTVSNGSLQLDAAGRQFGPTAVELMTRYKTAICACDTVQCQADVDDRVARIGWPLPSVSALDTKDLWHQLRACRRAAGKRDWRARAAEFVADTPPATGFVPAEVPLPEEPAVEAGADTSAPEEPSPDENAAEVPSAEVPSPAAASGPLPD